MRADFANANVGSADTATADTGYADSDFAGVPNSYVYTKIETRTAYLKEFKALECQDFV